MATFRRIAFAFLALVAVFGAVAAQAAPVVAAVPSGELAFAAACHCDAGCDASACADMGGCVQACAKLSVFVTPIAARPTFVPVAGAAFDGLHSPGTGHDWPPPLHPPRI